MIFRVLNHKLKLNWFVYIFKLVFVYFICFCFIPVSHAALKGDACDISKPIKVAVLSVGLQKNSNIYFSQILKKLGDDGFVAENKIPWNIDLRNKKEYQKYVTDAVKGKCLEFPSEYAFFYNWEVTVLKDKLDDLRPLIEKKKIDMILSLGDLTAKFLIEDNPNVPVVCFDTNSTEVLWDMLKKTRNRKIAVVDDTRNMSDDIELFHTMFGYSNLGYLRDKNHLFDLYTSNDEVMKFVNEKKLPMKVCEGHFFIPDEDKAHEEFSRCMAELAASNVGAVFIPEVGNGIDMDLLYSQLRPLLSKKIATISYDSKAQVEAGSLLSVYDPNEYTRASYVADIIEDLVLSEFDPSVFINRKPLSVPLFFGVNLKTAAFVQWRPTFDVLVAVDDVFHTIKSK